MSIDVRAAQDAPTWFVRATRQTGELAWGRSAALGEPGAAEPGSVALVREGCGAPAAAGVLTRTGPADVEITSFGVLADMRGQGVGTALASSLTATAFVDGAARCRVAVADQAQADLFLGLGYRRIG